MEALNASTKKNINLKIAIYQLIVYILAWIGLMIRIFIAIIEVGSGTEPVLYLGDMSSYFTVQTNILVLFWLTLALVYRNHEKKPRIMHPIVHGAICLYISGTFVIFAIFLSPYYQPTGIEAVANILMHYIVPLAFILEWFITELDTQYQYRYLLYYTIYPLAYLFYTLIRGTITGFYPYWFFDLNNISIIQLVINVIFLMMLFTIIASIYIALNRKIYKSR
ncbi:MAG: hypothetical protein GF353_12800 [Candidatus Lokiarchaeota archaeon]|nr:hypothetical protein [Candidatus Lokiarchaeota archaeon]